MNNPSQFFESDILNLLVRFVFNFLMVLIIVRYIYYRHAKRKDYLFTFFLINLIVFLLCVLLSDVELKLGFAFGLFALFGILRYRTMQIPIKEMTYLFVVIGISVINSISDEHLTYGQILFSNFAIILILYFLEYKFLLSHESSKTVTYEKIDLIHEQKRNELIKDLKERTGINIHRIEIHSFNFLRDTAKITIFYYDKVRMLNVNDNLVTGVDDDD